MNFTSDQIEQEILRIKKLASSPAEIQVQMIGLLCKCIIAEKAGPDPYVTPIEEFHKKFGIAYDGPPRRLPPGLRDFRINFLKEELQEYIDAVTVGNLEKQFDALIDLVYVALGTAHLQGLPFRAGFDRVQYANMQKMKATRETEGTRPHLFDITKPYGWKAPVLLDLITPPL